MAFYIFSGEEYEKVENNLFCWTYETPGVKIVWVSFQILTPESDLVNLQVLNF
jgi:hypothetical protein